MAIKRVECNPTGVLFARRLHPSVVRLMFKPRIVRSALKVSLVVGTVLNLINNGEQFWLQQPFSYWHCLLNYVVPFCVSSYSAARNQARHAQED